MSRHRPPEPPRGRRSRADRPAPSTVVDEIDWSGTVRSASLGFTVLVLGVLVTPVVAMMSPGATVVWPCIAGAAAFGLASARLGSAPAAILHGTMAAAGAYLLALPVLLAGPVMLPAPVPPALGVIALVVGPAAVFVSRQIWAATEHLAPAEAPERSRQGVSA